MTLVSSQEEFKALVLKTLEELPRQQQQVAEYLLDHLREAPFLSIPELSARAKVSEATVVRLAQRLGYPGFSSLRTDLLDAVRHRVAGPANEHRPEDADPAVGEDTLGAVARLELMNIEKSVSDFDRASFQRLATDIFRADHVFTFGLGVSTHMAGLLAYLLTQIGLRATAISPGYSSPLEPLCTLRPTDLLLAFSFPPYSKQTIGLLRRANEDGIRTIAVCDRPSAPAAQVARDSLAVRSDNMMFTNSFAAISVLLNALTTEIALRHGDRASDAVSRISRILESDDNLIEGTR